MKFIKSPCSYMAVGRLLMKGFRWSLWVEGCRWVVWAAVGSDLDLISSVKGQAVTKMCSNI